MSDEMPAKHMSDKEVMKFLERKKKEVEDGTQSGGPSPEGVCVVCKTLSVRARLVAEPFTTSTPIGCKLPVHQDGYYCTKCGLRYEFPPMTVIRVEGNRKRRNRTKK